MKKMIGAAILCLSMLTSLKAENYIDYVSLGLAVQTLQDSNIEDFNALLEDDYGFAVVANVGKYIYDDIALEFEGSASVVKPEWRLPTGESDKVDFFSLGFYGTYIWRINNISIKPRIGLVYEKMSSKLQGLRLKDTADLGLSGGIGLSYQFANHYEVFTNFTKFEDDINHLTFGATYKF